MNNIFNIARVSNSITKVTENINTLNPPLIIPQGGLISNGKITIPSIFIEDDGIVKVKKIRVFEQCDGGYTLNKGDIQILFFDNDNELGLAQGTVFSFDVNTAPTNLALKVDIQSADWEDLAQDSYSLKLTALAEAFIEDGFIARSSSGYSLSFAVINKGVNYTLDTNNLTLEFFIERLIK